MTTAHRSEARTPKPNAAAHRNHEDMLPNHNSALQFTDPEFIGVFDNFAFDEVLAESQLNTTTRVIMMLAALIGCQSVNEYKIMFGAALNVGVTPVEIKEVLYQSVPSAKRECGVSWSGRVAPSATMISTTLCDAKG